MEGEVDIFRKLFNDDKKSKIIIIGPSGVGKTSLRQRYIKGSFRTHLMTIGVEYTSQKINIDGEEITLEIFDTAGQDGFDLNKSVLKNPHGVILVFDVTRHDSFFSIRSWIDKIYEHNPKSKAPMIIVGNKSDLESDREIPSKDAIKFVESLEHERQIHAKHIKFLETSAKTGQNIDLVFNTLANYILDCYY